MPAAAGSATKKAPSLKGWIAKLKEIQSSFNDIWEFVEQFPDGSTITEIEVRLQKLEELWEKFGETLVEIKSHDDFPPESGDAYDKERREFSNRYYRAKPFLLERIKEHQATPLLEQSTHAGDTTMQGSLDHVRLPQIKLQSFDGNIDEWLSFRDLFTSLIHCKADLPEVEKFHYLKGCLQGEPKGLVDPLQITRSNYLIAWDMLLKRYDNSKQLKKRQVQSLFQLPTVSKECPNQLHALLEGFERIVQTLDQIVQPIEYKDLLLTNLLTTRLDPITRRGWEEISATQKTDTVKELLEFLRRRTQVLECLPSRIVDTKGGNQLPPQRLRPVAVKTSYSTVQSSGIRCTVCSANHLLFQCETFQRMSVTERDALVRTHSLCRNCFRLGHQAKDCQSKYSCRSCKSRHHTMVCFKRERENTSKNRSTTTTAATPCATTGKQPSTPTNLSQIVNMVATSTSVSNSATYIKSTVLLATAVLLVEDDHGNQVPARALLDSGSESNFISEKLSQRLKVDRKKVDISVLGIGQAATRVKQRIQATIRSRISDFTREMGFLVLPKVTVHLPTATVNVKGWSIPEGIQLADPSFCVSMGIDLVLGIEAFFDFFVSGRKITLGEQMPSLNESVFGWVVSGGLSSIEQAPRVSCHVTTKGLDELIAKFWACEEIELKRSYSKEEERCEEIFKQTVQRGTDGRYTVAMPMVEDAFTRLGESKNIALRRLQGTERRLARNSDLKQQYLAFMSEYIELGHMRLIKETQRAAAERCYLPHHPVVKEASTTTKVRVVFDASCKTSTNTSLNEVLLVGPVIQEELRSIILRCRTKQIMLVADVEKMFRQIFIRPEDRPLQCILWRSSPTDEVATYELNTVTYGTKPAPFLATRTLNQLAKDEGARFPLAARAVMEDTYMDDVITGSNDQEEAHQLRLQLDAMMNSGGFRLRKWASNCAEVLREIPTENLAISDVSGINLDPDPSVKTLGLTWMPRTDVFRFQFKIPPLEKYEELSKRQILSIIATLFDPLGLIGAVITSAKIFMQLLWTLQTKKGSRLDWDEPLPLTVGESWRRFYSRLPLLNEIRINRCVILPGAVTVELHCFSDASEKAYGGCVYIRSMDSTGNVAVQLLTSKSKVAPLRCQTIPRLELCGAELVAKLYGKIQQSLKLNLPTYFWTDSTCVLRWIQTVPTTWSTYIANRVSKIQGLTEPNTWRHVPGVQNPADLISRGISAEDILHNDFWWHGPSWLAESQEFWPKTLINQVDDEAEEKKRRAVIAATVSSTAEFTDWYLGKFSSFSKLLRHTVIWLRAREMFRSRGKRYPSGFLTTKELREAERTLIERVQRECFSMEWEALSKGEAVSQRSSLRWLNPKISQDGLIRVGGRLQHAQEPFDTKHPIVLPARHHLTKLIFLYYHGRMLHAGPQLLLSVVKLRYWPLRGRDAARQTVHKCQKCFRANPTSVPQFMGDLPAARVNVARPFSKTGVDYFGPIYLRPAPRRPIVKAYGSIFVCFCTKAVHIELVSDLSTERFLQALRRFVARRGRPSDLYSDNGTNFVGARNKLQELLRLLKNKEHHGRVAKYCAEDGVQWHFSPPSAPHFGGLWEAAVRSAKHHILRVLGENPATSEDMSTLLVQVEGCLNSRPITASSEDPNDLEPLTPAHFLVGASLQALPDQNYLDIPTNRLKQWQLVQRNVQNFWIRWKREYLSQLQSRIKRWRVPVPIEEGKLVIIKDDNLPPLRWKTGRIQKVHPGQDGVVRVVTLKTAAGFLTRPVEKICILPSAEFDEDDEGSGRANQ
ncbi:uncharacterized protein LOC129728133 [Wyeomyia smithii]|uniref:uncharacterized protein LOC129728133 n=1 Tax=Wyeomyia smithii TaxID=174621 RepID=UPI002467C74B|nr:uncharacterized protein LOC129728133 [Wyeomyia smithii]